jgi:hypothetical protein
MKDPNKDDGGYERAVEQRLEEFDALPEEEQLKWEDFYDYLAANPVGASYEQF